MDDDIQSGKSIVSVSNKSSYHSEADGHMRLAEMIYEVDLSGLSNKLRTDEARESFSSEFLHFVTFYTPDQVADDFSIAFLDTINPFYKTEFISHDFDSIINTFDNFWRYFSNR